MAYVTLEFGFVMDEATKAIYKVRGSQLIESSAEEYERVARFMNKKSSILSDFIEINSNELPSDLYYDEARDIYYTIEDSFVVLYKIQEGSEFIEPKYLSYTVTDLEDLKILLSNEHILVVLNELFGFEPKVDGRMYMEIFNYKDQDYRINYRIDNTGIAVGIHKLVKSNKPSNTNIKIKKSNLLKKLGL